MAEKPRYGLMEGSGKQSSTLLVLELEANGMADVLIDAQAGLKLITKKTLLFIVDTHRVDFTESREII